MTSVRQWLGSLLFTGWVVLSWIPFALALLVAGPFHRAAGYRIARAWAQTVLGLARVLCGIRFEVEGREHIRATNTVVMLKHSSAFETLAELVVFPRQCWVLKRELMWIPIFGWALALLRPIAINRRGGRSAVDQVVAQGRARLAQGYWVMVFPEGTRTALGHTRRYGISGALLARETGRSIVPVAHNAAQCWPRRGWLKRPGTVRMVIGPPVPTEGRELREINAEVQDWIEHRVAGLTGLPKAQPPARNGAANTGGRGGQRRRA